MTSRQGHRHKFGKELLVITADGEDIRPDSLDDRTLL
jgi:hypothetical protein